MAGSSSYPRSITACRRARVTESLVANSVTSQPRETRPSVMLPATVSHAPYCRGGVRQATGDRIATFLLGIVMPVRGFPVPWHPTPQSAERLRSLWTDRPDHKG